MSNQTHEEINEIVEQMSTSLRSLNDALAKAHDAGLDVKISSIRTEILGKRGALEIYNAEISKLEFRRRV